MRKFNVYLLFVACQVGALVYLAYFTRTRRQQPHVTDVTSRMEFDPGGGALRLSSIRQPTRQPGSGSDRNGTNAFPDDPWSYISVNKNKTMDFQCDVCALVTSSGHLLGSRAGQEIDSASCVIRMNVSPVQGFEDDVGSRTTLRMISFLVSLYDIEFKRDMFGSSKEQAPEFIVLWSSMAKDVFPNVLKSFKLLSENYTNIDFYYASQTQRRYADKLFEIETGKSTKSSGSWLTTGWFTLSLLIHACNQIKIYGMVDSEHCDSKLADVPYHYYEPNSISECKKFRGMEFNRKGGHRFNAEKYIFRKWAEVANITFYHPSWNITKIPNKKPPFLELPDSKIEKNEPGKGG